MKRNIIIIIGITIGILLSFGLRAYFHHRREVQIEKGRQGAWEKVQPHLSKADTEIAEAAEKNLGKLYSFFQLTKTKTPAFAERCLSFKSKWVLLTGDHKAFLKEEFDNLVFSATDLDTQIRQAIGDYIRDVQQIEGKLLVDVQTDMNDLPNLKYSDCSSKEAFTKRINELVADSSQKTKVAVSLDVTQVAASEITAFIMAKLAVIVAERLGLSTAILGGGSLGASESFGLTIVAGIVIDQIVGCIITWAYSPEQKISDTINYEIDMLCLSTIGSKQTNDGLRGLFSKIAAAQIHQRDEAIKTFVFESEIQK